MDDKMFELLEKIYAEVQGHTEQFKNVENRLDSLEKEVKKNSMKLESVETKIETLSEIQKSYMDQNDKQHTEIVLPMKESINIIELAVKNTSKDIQDLSGKFDKVEKVTIQNTYDVAYLKSVK